VAQLSTLGGYGATPANNNQHQKKETKMKIILNSNKQNHTWFQCPALVVLTVIIGGCASPQASQNQVSQSQASQESKPAANDEVVATARIKKWQQDCDQGKYANEQPQTGQPSQSRVYGQDLKSFYMVKRKNNDFLISLDLPAADGKPKQKGMLIQMRNQDPFSGRQVVGTTLAGYVWTPRANFIGKLDLTTSSKITASPDFSFDAFKDSPDVIPFANGYAVNLFCQKLINEEGLVDETPSPSSKVSYVSDDGKPLYGRLIRMRYGKLEEIIFAP
jgi:hypothetical protein